MIKEKDIKNGAVLEIHDSRDYIFSASFSKPFNWKEGYDIEKEIGFKLPIKNQGRSSSCGGQAFSYYAQVLEYFNTGTFEERSAKFLYSQVALPNGQGSRGRDLCKILKSQGDAREAFCPSYYVDGVPLSELEYIKTKSINEIIRNDAKSSMAISYQNLVSTNIETIAQAIRDNKGVVLGVAGQNRKGWLTEFPKLPNKHQWNHWVYACKARLIDGKKYIGIINSWGEDCGDNGIQWLPEEYFDLYLPKHKAIFQGWTIELKKVDEKRNLLKTLLLAIIKMFKK